MRIAARQARPPRCRHDPTSLLTAAAVSAVQRTKNNAETTDSAQLLFSLFNQTLKTGIDLTKRNSGMHFFELQVETEKN